MWGSTFGVRGSELDLKRFLLCFKLEGLEFNVGCDIREARATIAQFDETSNSYSLVLLQDEDLSSSDPSDLFSCSVYSTVYQPTVCWDLPQPSAAHVSLLVTTGNLLANTRYVSFPLFVVWIHQNPLEGLFTRNLDTHYL